MKATTWQQKNIPNINALYSSRINRIKEYLKICKNYDYSVLVTHYASSLATVYGEPPSVHKFLGFPLIETMDKNLRPHIAIHGHAHNAVRTFALVGGTIVYNVSLPANKKITVIELAT